MPAAAIVGGSVVGGLISASGAKSAAKSQAQAAAQADATQRYQFDETNRLNAPFRETGVLANNQLSYLMGLSKSKNGSTGVSANDLIDTSGDQWRPNADLYANSPQYKQAWDAFYAGHQERFGGKVPSVSGGTGLSSGQRQLMEDYGFDLNAYNKQQMEAEGPTDDSYGSLLRNYGQSDADNDYIYQTQKQFGLDEGVKGINRTFAANGGLQSGAIAKALTRFGNDYAGTKLGESYNRFENNKTGTYNKLAGISGAGQQATNQITAAGTNMANNISSNQIGLGNARGASAIAQGNALSGGISNAINGYQQNQLMNSFGNNYSFDQANGYGSEMARLNGSIG